MGKLDDPAGWGAEGRESTSLWLGLGDTAFLFST